MAKLKSDPIGQADLLAYLASQSDFSFELQVLKALRDTGLACEHGGTYDDPTTNKPRQFDIRATKNIGRRFLRLAVECKNLRTNYPLLAFCVPRRTEEAYHEIIRSVTSSMASRLAGRQMPGAIIPVSWNIPMQGAKSIYKPGDPVGKACAQVGRTEKDDEIQSG
jgi:hypothetical protein